MATNIGTSGNDTIIGKSFADMLFGRGGNDILSGRGGDDTIIGGRGKDKLFGGDGNDTLIGGGGRDKLYGGTGNDLLTGGAGADRFVFGAQSGKDVITDFSTSNDLLLIPKGLNGINKPGDVLKHAVQKGADVVIDLGGGNTIKLKGVDLDSLKDHPGDHFNII